jgi:hypothetical protein
VINQYRDFATLDVLDPPPKSKHNQRFLEKKLVSSESKSARAIVEKFAVTMGRPDVFWDPSKPRPGREQMPEWRRNLSLQHYYDPKLSARFKTSALFGNRESRLPCLVEGILPAKGIVGLIGDQQSFKTFLATDLALHIAFGRPWFGRRVSKGAVVYISAEAPEVNQDIRNAWSKAHPEFVDQGQFMPIDSSPELGTKDGDAADLIAFIRQEEFRDSSSSTQRPRFYTGRMRTKRAC